MTDRSSNSVDFIRLIPIRALAHRFVALEAELFAEGGVGFAGGIFSVDGELEFTPAPADLSALAF